jgi:hypothetical protein
MAGQSISYGASVGGFSGAIGRVKQSGAWEVAAFRKKFPKMVEIALQKTFKFWLRNYAPRHFERQAFTKYPAEFADNWKKNPEGRRKKRLESSVRYGRDTDRPLVKTGALKQAFINGSFRFDRLPQSSGIRAVWLDLPKYAYMFKYKKGGGTTFKIQDALVAVADSELLVMGKVFEAYLQEEINREDPASRSKGIMVFG